MKEKENKKISKIEKLNKWFLCVISEQLSYINLITKIEDKTRKIKSMWISIQKNNKFISISKNHKKKNKTSNLANHISI